MILVQPFVSQKSVDELVAILSMLAERRRSYYAAIQLVRAARTGIDEPIIHPRASVRRMDGGMAEVTFFRDDAPDDETLGTVNRWHYFDEDGELVQGNVIAVTLEPNPIGTVVTLACYDDEYLTEFRRLLAAFGETLPELTERDQETQVDAPTGDELSDDVGQEVQAAAQTGDAPIEDVDQDTPSAGKPAEKPWSIYEFMPMCDKPKWPKSEWIKLFQYFESWGINDPSLKEISQKTGKPYEYVRKVSSRYKSGQWD